MKKLLTILLLVISASLYSQQYYFRGCYRPVYIPRDPYPIFIYSSPGSSYITNYRHTKTLEPTSKVTHSGHLTVNDTTATVYDAVGYKLDSITTIIPGYNLLYIDLTKYDAEKLHPRHFQVLKLDKFMIKYNINGVEKIDYITYKKR